MKKDQVIIDQTYKGMAIGISESVTGKVIKLLENCVILSVTSFNEYDSFAINNKQDIVMVRYQDLENIDYEE